MRVCMDCMDGGAEDDVDDDEGMNDADEGSDDGDTGGDRCDADMECDVVSAGGTGEMEERSER